MSGFRLKPWALATAGGVLWALALPSWHALWALPVAAMALVTLLREEARKNAFFLGFWAGFCQWFVALSWVSEVMTRYGHLPGPLAFLALAAMCAILGSFWGLAFWMAARVAGAWRWVVLALGLAAGEVLQGLWPFDFPWNPLAAALVQWPVLLAPLPVLGATVYGFFLRVALFSGATALLGRDREPIRWALAAAGVVVVAGVGAPDFRATGERLKVAAIQPNVPLEVRWDPDNLRTIEGWVWGLSRQAVEAGARWVVWPESAVPRVLEQDEAYRGLIVRFAQGQGVWLTLNSIGLGRPGEYFNSMYSVAPEGRVARYDKVHLVPFGEYVPFFGRIAFFRALVREVGGFTPGKGAQLLPGPGFSLGGAVCYEVAFPLHAAEQVRHGAGVLVTVTNDGWYGNSAAPYQHLALAILRAAETRRFLVRAANTGISAIVDPYGRVSRALPLGERGVIVEEVQAGAGLTPVARWAVWFHLSPVVGFGLVILWSAWRSRSRRKVNARA